MVPPKNNSRTNRRCLGQCACRDFTLLTDSAKNELFVQGKQVGFTTDTEMKTVPLHEVSAAPSARMGYSGTGTREITLSCFQRKVGGIQVGLPRNGHMDDQ